MENKSHSTVKGNLQRLNYLYQVTNVIAENHLEVTPFYNNLIVNAAKKSVQRLGSNIKRRMCKRCKTMLVEQISCKVRIRKKHIIRTCLVCGLKKSYKTKYKLHINKS